ncbi:ras-like protein family member 10A isoform X1 [Crocuta crocuta]
MGGSLRVAVLGAPGVGKTAIIRQFLFGDYPERHRPTDGPRLYRPAVLLDGAVYDLSIRDGDGAPPSQNPGGPEEWLDPKDWSLQDTDAFVLVYDICSPDSFDYVKALRQRISETRQQAGPAEAALRASARAGRPGAQGLALRLPRVFRQVQLARAASLPRAAALRFGARASRAPGLAPAGGAASGALQPHVTELDDAAAYGGGRVPV